MNYLRRTLILFFASFLSFPAMAEEPEIFAPSRILAVWTTEGVDSEMLQAVTDFVAKHTRLVPEIRGTWQPEGKTFETIASEKIPQAENVFANVLILSAPEETRASLLLENNKHLLINFDVVNSVEGVKQQRRLERLFMRGIADIADLGPCPNSQCCLFAYEKPEQIDFIGRNYCPPCSLRYDSKMKEMKVPLPDPRELFLQKMKEMQKTAQ